MRLVESDSETTELIAELDAAGYAPDDYMVDLNQAFDISKSLLLAASERKQGARQPQAQLQPQPPPMSQPQLALLSLHDQAGGFYDDPCSSLLALLDSPSVPPLGGGVRPFASLLPTLVEGELPVKLPAFNAEAFVAEALNFAPSEARSAARSAHSAAGSATGSARQAAGSALQRLYTEEEMLKSADRARFEGRFEGAFVGEVRAARCLNAQLGAIHAQLGTLVEHVDAGHADLAAHITTGNAGLAAHVTEAAAGVEAQISANNAGLAELITAVEQSSKETLEAVKEVREAGQAAAEAGQGQLVDAAAEREGRRGRGRCARVARGAVHCAVRNARAPRHPGRHMAIAAAVAEAKAEAARSQGRGCSRSRGTAHAAQGRGRQGGGPGAAARLCQGRRRRGLAGG